MCYWRCPQSQSVCIKLHNCRGDPDFSHLGYYPRFQLWLKQGTLIIKSAICILIIVSAGRPHSKAKPLHSLAHPILQRSIAAVHLACLVIHKHSDAVHLSTAVRQ